MKTSLKNHEKKIARRATQIQNYSLNESKFQKNHKQKNKFKHNKITKTK